MFIYINFLFNYIFISQIVEYNWIMCFGCLRTTDFYEKLLENFEDRLLNLAAIKACFFMGIKGELK